MRFELDRRDDLNSLLCFAPEYDAGCWRAGQVIVGVLNDKILMGHCDGILPL